MRLVISRYQVMCVLIAAGVPYLGCTERNDVAREKPGRPAGSSSGAADSGAAGAPGAAGGDGNEGGSDGTGGSLGVSGAGRGDAGDGSGGAAGDGNLGDASVILVVGNTVTPETIVGTSYVAGAWAPVQLIQDGYGFPGLGVAVLLDGTGLAGMSGGFFATATWNGDWSTSTSSQDPQSAGGIAGRMASTMRGAFIAQWVPSAKIQLNTYNAMQQSWTFGETASPVISEHQPAVTYVGMDDPLVAYYNPSEAEYQWVRRTGNTWSQPEGVPVVAQPLQNMFNPNLDLIRRVGVDQVVGVFLTDFGELECSLFQNGGWSSPELIATDASTVTPQARYTYLAALSDGRVALAYWTQDFGIKLGFFDGSHWSEFKVVPGVKALGRSPLGLSRGAAGAVVELVYSQQESPQYQLRHARLTNEANWTWTPGALVDGDHLWANIAIAASP